jgi:hypothetical protein
MEFEQTPEYLLGRRGEMTVMDRLVKRGHWVTDTASLPPEHGHGPRVHGRGEMVPADLDVVLRPWGFRVLLQVKTKTRADMGRITHELEHGFSWLDWLEYREAEKQFGAPVFVVVVELRPRLAILAQRVSQLRVRADCPTLNNGQQMAYFPRSQFAEDGIARIERCAEQTTARRMKRRNDDTA